MKELYSPFLEPIVISMDIRSAEMTNTRQTLCCNKNFIHERNCEYLWKVGADVNNVGGMSSDNKFVTHLFTGCGYGGSCF